MTRQDWSIDATRRMNLSRFWSTLEASAEIGVGRPGGLSRLALGDDDRRMRDLFADWCRDAGLDIRIDAIGNMFARRAGDDDAAPPVVTGSHLDTQVNGGRFDGIVGVLAGLELCRTLNDAGLRTKRAIEIVNWTNEEGGRFSPPMVGSGCFVGAYALDWALERRDEDGVSIGEELARIGYRGDAALLGRPFDSCIEFHIEQGPILDRENMQVGVVTGGYVSSGVLAEFRGETAHTGPWPMELRRNALVAAARFLVAVDDIGWAHAATDGKGTAARLSAWPNKAGILSDWAQAVGDVRHPDPAIAARMAEALREAARDAAARAHCDLAILDTWNWGGDIFAPDLIGSVRSTARALGYRTRDLKSQAGHDSYFLARHAPTTMIFAPCRGGVTHNNAEYCSPEDLEPGLNTLLHVVLARANR